MHQWKSAVLVTVMGLLGCGVARAEGTFIAAANRTDMVSDPVRRVIYIANGDEVLRYGRDCGCMLDPIALGGKLKGIDLSPDAKTLAVADDSTDGTNVWVDLVDLETLVVTRADIARTIGEESGSFSVSFLTDGSLIVAFTFDGSGFAPIRKLDLSTMIWSTIANNVAGSTRTSVSGDKKIVAYAENLNSSYESVGVYDSSVDSFKEFPAYFDNCCSGNYGVAINANGTQFAIPTYQGTYIYNSSHQKVAKIGVYVAPHPVGVAYDPVASLAYFPWSTTKEVRVYDMRTFQQVGSYNFEDTFTGGWPFTLGNTRVSRDGSLLMVAVTGGVRFVDMLKTEAVSATSDGGRVKIILPGIKFGVGMAVDLPTQPAHGQAFLRGNVLTYVPDPGFSGTDTFSYATHYQGNVSTAAVTIMVTANKAPYSPLVSFDTLPALSPTTPVAGSTHVSGDFNGDGISDLLWFNPGDSQLGYWTMTADARTGVVKRTGTRTYKITAGYFVGASGDLDGDGYGDLVFTSGNHDLWLWTNNRQGGFTSTQTYSYPIAWQLIGAGDINGDGKDDLLWLDPSDCQFAYWLMDGKTRIGSRVVSVACGYYPAGVGYFTSSKRLSIVWTSAAGDLYMWDSQPGGGFHSYDLTSVYTQLGLGIPDPRNRWAIGGGYAGQGLGVESYDPSTDTGFGALLWRSFNSFNQQTGYQAGVQWQGSPGIFSPGSAGYLLKGTGVSGTALYVLDNATGTIGISALGGDGGNAPNPGQGQWAYPADWYVIGAPANGATPLPWR